MPRSNCQPADTSIAQLKRVGERLKSIIASAPPHRKAQVIAYARTLFVRLEREALGRLPQHGCGGQCVRSATVGVLNSLEDAPRQRRNVRLAQAVQGVLRSSISTTTAQRTKSIRLLPTPEKKQKQIPKQKPTHLSVRGGKNDEDSAIRRPSDPIRRVL